MNKILNNKVFSVIIILIIYVLAFLVGFLTYKYLPIENILLKFFICDLLATIIVFMGSMLFRNSSVYDPYWSILPMIITPFFIKETSGFIMPNIIILIFIELWGLRLTLNWLIRFKSLKNQDWRYTNLQTKHPKLWPVISFTGIHLVPTLVVFFAMLPVFAYVNVFMPIEVNNEVITPMPINGTFFICILVSFLAILLETVADAQMQKFKKDITNAGKINRTGLWKVSRHPNYFGEILFWFSMFLFYISVDTKLWVLVFSPLIVFLLFVVVSIPMMEKREINNKEGYEEYKKETNMLLPFFPPQNNKK